MRATLILRRAASSAFSRRARTVVRRQRLWIVWSAVRCVSSCCQWGAWSRRFTGASPSWSRTATRCCERAADWAWSETPRPFGRSTLGMGAAW